MRTDVEAVTCIMIPFSNLGISRILLEPYSIVELDGYMTSKRGEPAALILSILHFKVICPLRSMSISICVLVKGVIKSGQRSSWLVLAAWSWESLLRITSSSKHRTLSPTRTQRLDQYQDTVIWKHHGAYPGRVMTDSVFTMLVISAFCSSYLRMDSQS